VPFLSARLTERGLVFWVSLIGYIAVAVGLVLGAHNIVGDAWSRVGNAYYVLYSRDPHLAAIGFVWNPLPSLLTMPLLPLKAIFPALVEMGFAACIVSCVSMAAAVGQIHGCLTDLRLGRRVRVALVVLFAVHPMTILYAANGMSEGLFLLFLLYAIRQLMRWVASPDVGSLVRAGAALALAYLTRYEAVAAAMAAIALVAAVSLARSERSVRRANALADALIVGLPFAAAFSVWAVMSWILVGSPFETFTSVYGNSSQVGLAIEGIRAATGQGTPAAITYAFAQIGGLEPLFLIAGVVSAAAAVWRRDLRALAPTAILGAVLLFALWAFLSGKSFGWLRFYIVSVPLVVLWAASFGDRRIVRVGAKRPLWLARVPAAVALVCCAAAVPFGVATMLTPALGREEAYQLHDLAPSGSLTEAVPQANRPFIIGGEAARYLDSLSLPRGSVLVDVATGFPIVLQSDQPTQFVITPDRDFRAALADPALFGIRYLIVQSGANQLDAVSQTYISLIGEGKLLRHFGGPTDNFGWDLIAVPAVEKLARE
jgi:hypothetical protein